MGGGWVDFWLQPGCEEPQISEAGRLPSHRTSPGLSIAGRAEVAGPGA